MPTTDVAPLQLVMAVLDLYREPLFVIDDRRRIVFRNVIGARVLRSRGGLVESGGRLSLGTTSADEQLRSIVQGLHSGSLRRRARGIRLVRPKSSGADWLLLIHPLSGPADTGRHPLFFVQGLCWFSALDAQLLALADLFGLTVREVSVARELLRTGSVAAVAESLALSRETIRTYTKRIFRKCDVHDKGDLLRILLWVAEFPGTE